MWTERDRPEPDHQKQFHAAVSVIQSLPKNGSYRPSYEEMLRFYSYYKQATQGPCHMPRPGFWDPIGRYKWDAWHRLGRMSQKEAMAAYITEMKVVAQKVIDTVPLSEVDDGMFNYFVPLYEMIPDMPQPPEVFLKKLTARKEKIPNGDMKMAFDPLPPPEEPAPQTSGAQLPRVPSIHGRASMDLDTEIFCDSLEQLEPEQGEWLQEELKESLVGEPDVSSDHLLSREREMLRTPQGPREFEAWLASTVQALQESMQDVQGRLRCLESLPGPAKSPQPQQGPWALELSTPTLLLLLLWPFVVQWIYRQFRRQKR